MAALAIAALLMQAPAARAQLPPWPTPPPGPVGGFPEVVPANEVTSVAAPVAPGSIALQVDPIFAGAVPRSLPRPMVQVVTAETDSQARVFLEFPAGSLTRTAQLTYEPVAIGLAPGPGPGQRLMRTFRLSLYDPKGAPTTPIFKVAVRMTLHPQPDDLAAAGNDQSRLFLARYDEGRRQWQPLVTNYYPANNSLTAHILQPGLFAVMTMPAPLS
ncbi:MAG: hypothetical protein HY532_04735 [Chloroflexi bacterium]|nr:hypothetical protein [Chloroflexota bacterium]